MINAATRESALCTITFSKGIQRTRKTNQLDHQTKKIHIMILTVALFVQSQMAIHAGGIDAGTAPFVFLTHTGDFFVVIVHRINYHACKGSKGDLEW